MTGKKKLLEVDLYEPIQKHFIKEGFEVYGEVKDCDLTALKETELIIVELKLTLSVDLLIQATKRQRLTEDVYIAIPRPKYKLNSKRWRDICNLIRRLELGLILVSFTRKKPQIEIIIHPSSFDRRKSLRLNKNRRNAILKEINGRSADFNVGGSSRAKIMTAYKENCIQIACYLEKIGSASPKYLTGIGTGEKTLSILNKNYYGWFKRIKRGVYEISDKGKNEIQNYPELVEYYLLRMNNKDKQ